MCALLASAAVPARLPWAGIVRLTLALVPRRAAAAIAARPLSFIASEALFRIGLSVPIRRMALLLLASVVVISRDHGSTSRERRPLRRPTALRAFCSSQSVWKVWKRATCRSLCLHRKKRRRQETHAWRRSLWGGCARTTGHTSERLQAEIGSFGADEAERVLRRRLPHMLPTQSPEIFELETNVSHALLEIIHSVTVLLARRHLSQSVGQKPLGM